MIVSQTVTLKSRTTPDGLRSLPDDAANSGRVLSVTLHGTNGFARAIGLPPSVNEGDPKSRRHTFLLLIRRACPRSKTQMQSRRYSASAAINTCHAETSTAIAYE